MFSTLRARLLVSGAVTIAVILALAAFLAIERSQMNATLEQLTALAAAAAQARELSLYARSSAHDTTAHLLGHADARERYQEHQAAFDERAQLLQELAASGMLDDHVGEEVTEIVATYQGYDQVARELLGLSAGNAIPVSPRTEQLLTDFEQMSDTLEAQSLALYDHINHDVQSLQDHLNARNRQMLSLLTSLAVVIVLLITIIQVMVLRAVGSPIQALRSSVTRFTHGEHSARASVMRQDEVGSLALAFNEMADTIAQQSAELRRQYDAAEAARLEAEAAQRRIAEQLAVISEQQGVIREMSVPVLPLSASVLVVPLVGALDTARLSLLQQQSLEAIERASARNLILDVTGVPVIDTQVAQGLLRVVQAARLLGAKVALAGVRPEVAQTMVSLGIALEWTVAYASLQSAIAQVSR